MATNVASYYIITEYPNRILYTLDDSNNFIVSCIGHCECMLMLYKIFPAIWILIID